VLYSTMAEIIISRKNRYTISAITRTIDEDEKTFVMDFKNMVLFIWVCILPLTKIKTIVVIIVVLIILLETLNIVLNFSLGDRLVI